MREPRVVHLTSVHPPFDARIFRKECSSLARAGYAVTLIVPHDKDEAVAGVQIKAVPKPRGRLARMTRTIWQIYREAARQRADLYHFHDPELILVGLLLWWWGKKVVYDVHEDVPRQILAKLYLPRWLRKPLGWAVECFEKLACRRFGAVVTATPAIALRFQTINPQTSVIQNFPLPEELKPNGGLSWAERPCSVAYVGSISINRGIREMVKAMALLPAAQSATLKLAGDYSPQNLGHELARLPGWKRVEALGFLDRTGVAEVLSQVRAGLVVIHPEPRYQVAYPVKMFEYMSAGIPVIASDFPLWREVIEGASCGLLVDPLSPQAIARAIEYVLTHPEEAEAMGRRGRKAVEERYNWRAEERELLALYEYLVESV